MAAIIFNPSGGWNLEEEVVAKSNGRVRWNREGGPAIFGESGVR